MVKRLKQFLKILCKRQICLDHYIIISNARYMELFRLKADLDITTKIRRKMNDKCNQKHDVASANWNNKR